MGEIRGKNRIWGSLGFAGPILTKTLWAYAPPFQMTLDPPLTKIFDYLVYAHNTYGWHTAVAKTTLVRQSHFYVQYKMKRLKTSAPCPSAGKAETRALLSSARLVFYC